MEKYLVFLLLLVLAIGGPAFAQAEKNQKAPAAEAWFCGNDDIIWSELSEQTGPEIFDTLLDPINEFSSKKLLVTNKKIILPDNLGCEIHSFVKRDFPQNDILVTCASSNVTEPPTTRYLILKKSMDHFYEIQDFVAAQKKEDDGKLQSKGARASAFPGGYLQNKKNCVSRKKLTDIFTSKGCSEKTVVGLMRAVQNVAQGCLVDKALAEPDFEEKSIRAGVYDQYCELKNKNSINVRKRESARLWQACGATATVTSDGVSAGGSSGVKGSHGHSTPGNR